MKDLYNCELLANAIVLQAVADYIDARCRIEKKTFNNKVTEEMCNRTVRECKAFFDSPEFGLYTSLGRDYLLETCERVLVDDFLTGKREVVNMSLLFDK